MYLLAMLVIGLSGYGAFARTRAGADPARSVCDGLLYATPLALLIVATTIWLSGAESSEVIADIFGILGLAFLTALVGAFIAGTSERRGKLAHW